MLIVNISILCYVFYHKSNPWWIAWVSNKMGKEGSGRKQMSGNNHMQGSGTSGRLHEMGVARHAGAGSGISGAPESEQEIKSGVNN